MGEVAAPARATVLPAPYYERDGITLYHGNCLELLGALPRASVDLVATDPPYGMNYRASSMRRRALPTEAIAGDDGTARVLVPYAIRESLRALKDKRHLYVFGPFDLKKIQGLASPVTLIWHKGRQMSVGNLHVVWGRNYEPIQFAVKSSGTDLQHGSSRLTARMRRGAVIHCQRVNGTAVRYHLTQKPIRLMRELIESSSVFDEVILDPFSGAGSTLLAARLEGRRAIGIELEERYCEIAAKRLEVLRADPLIRLDAAV